MSQKRIRQEQGKREGKKYKGKELFLQCRKNGCRILKRMI